MAWLRRLLLLLLFPAAAFGQGIRYDNFVLKPLPAGGVTPVSGALITVCTSAGAGQPCAPKVANIYSDETLTTPIVGTGGAGTTNSDAFGNYGFYITPGSYVVTITGSGITSSTVKVTLGTVGINATNLTGPGVISGAFSGNHSTTGLFSPKNIDNVLFCDQFAGATADIQINAAISALPSVGGFIDCRGYGATTQTIAATVNFGTVAGKTVTAWIDRSTTFLCTITNNTPCFTVNGGSSLLAFGTEPAVLGTAGLILNGNAAVSNMLLVTQNLASNVIGGFVEGVTVQGAGGTATVSDAVCAAKNILQLTKLTNITCNAAGLTNTVMLKIYATAAGLSVTNLVIENSYIDGNGLTGNRPVWVGCAASGSLTPISCAAPGSIQSVDFSQNTIVHPGTGLPIITVEASNGAAGTNTVANINFIHNQLESSHATDIGIQDNGAESMHVFGLYATINGSAGADLIKLTQPAGTSLDGVDIVGIDSNSTWTNIINNTFTGRVVPMTGGAQRGNYHYTKAAGSIKTNVWDDGAQLEAIIDTNGLTAPHSINVTNLLVSGTAPTIAGAGCGGSAATIPSNNGTAAFTINAGTAPTTACTVTLPTATTGWACFATDITTNSTAVFLQKQSGGSATTAVITNYNDVAVAANFTANDIIRVSCHGY